MKTINLIIVVSCILATILSQRTPQALKDQVKLLDGYFNFTNSFEMYSGYLNIQASPEISIHYVFITSMRNSSKDDVTLWLNGGPGCSSLLGFAQEVGPGNLLSGSKFFSELKNPYSWNTVSNMLFLQSPAGVGFSINDDETYNYTDPRTAQDGLKAIQQFYKRFPEFIPNKFWISGQSYCGMYIPFLANQILTNDPKINLQGILIGNGAMWLNMDWRRSVGDRFMKSHYYFGPQISQLISKCKYNSHDQDSRIPSCARGMAMADRATDLVNPYMTTGVCYTPADAAMENNVGSLNKRRFSRVPFHTIRNPLLSEVKGGSDSPCTDDVGISGYFNIAKVKEQLHINRNITWTPCSEIQYNMSNSSLDFFPNFKAKGIKILLYSGNVDAVVPYVETEQYIKFLGWKQIGQKTSFVNDRKSLMGWKIQYQGLTYVIINGAGHMVPADKPHAAYDMFSKFIAESFEQNQLVTQ